MTAQSGLGFSGIAAIQIPDDGALGQVLTKQSADNYDYDWEDPAGGFVGLGIWRFRTEIVAPPGSGQVRFNNATIESATIMWINETNDGGTDVSVFLDLLRVGSLVFLQDQGDADNFVLVEIATITDEGTYREITIEEVEAQGTAFTQNLRIAVIISGASVSPQRQFFDAMSKVGFVFSDFLDVTGLGKTTDGLSPFPAGLGSGISTPTGGYDFTNHPGVWGLNTGTASAGRVFLLSQVQQGFHVGVGELTRLGFFYQSPAVASIAANRYVLRAGMTSMGLPNTINQGITFEAQDDQNGGRWQAICDDAPGVETSVDTGVAVGTSKYVFLEIEINAAGTSVEFFIDGVSVAIITTNIPSGTGFGHFISIHIMKLTGVLNRAAYIDAYYFFQELTR